MLEIIFLLTTGRLVSYLKYPPLLAALYTMIVIYFATLFTSILPTGRIDPVMLGAFTFVVATTYYWLLLKLEQSFFIWLFVWFGGIPFVLLVPSIAIQQFS